MVRLTKRKKCCLNSFGAIAGIATVLLGPLVHTSLASELIHKKILENGLVVLVNELSESPSVALYALVKTGSATEGKPHADSSEHEKMD